MMSGEMVHGNLLKKRALLALAIVCVALISGSYALILLIQSALFFYPWLGLTRFSTWKFIFEIHWEEFGGWRKPHSCKCTGNDKWTETKSLRRCEQFICKILYFGQKPRSYEDTNLTLRKISLHHSDVPDIADHRIPQETHGNDGYCLSRLNELVSG